MLANPLIDPQIPRKLLQLKVVEFVNSTNFISTGVCPVKHPSRFVRFRNLDRLQNLKLPITYLNPVPYKSKLQHHDPHAPEPLEKIGQSPCGPSRNSPPSGHPEWTAL